MLGDLIAAVVRDERLTCHDVGILLPNDETKPVETNEANNDRTHEGCTISVGRHVKNVEANRFGGDNLSSVHIDKLGVGVLLDLARHCDHSPGHHVSPHEDVAFFVFLATAHV